MEDLGTLDEAIAKQVEAEINSLQRLVQSILPRGRIVQRKYPKAVSRSRWRACLFFLFLLKFADGGKARWVADCWKIIINFAQQGLAGGWVQLSQAFSLLHCISST